MASRAYILVNSSEQERGVDGVWRFQLNNRLPQTSNTKGVRVIQATVSHTWHLLPDDIPFRFSEDGGNTWLEVFLFGSPSMSALTTMLSNEMTAVSSISGNSETYTVSFDPIDGTLSIGSTDDFRLDYAAKMNQILGFKELVGGDEDADTHLGSHIVNMLRYANLYLRANLDGSRRVYNASQQRQNNLLAVIPVSGAFGEQLVYEPPHPIVIATNSVMDFLEFRLTNNKGDDVELNGGFWTVTIEVET